MVGRGTEHQTTHGRAGEDHGDAIVASEGLDEGDRFGGLSFERGSTVRLHQPADETVVEHEVHGPCSEDRRTFPEQGLGQGDAEDRHEDRPHREQEDLFQS